MTHSTPQRFIMDLCNPAGPKWFERINRAAPARWHLEPGGHEVSAAYVYGQCRGEKVDVFVCGYNSKLEDGKGAKLSYATISKNLAAHGSPATREIWVIWPTSTKAGYWWAEFKVYWDGFTPGVGDAFRDAIRPLTKGQPLEGSRMRIIAHSLGNGVTADAFRDGDMKAHLWVQTNPAIAQKSIELPKGDFVKSVQSFDAVLLFHSKRDQAGSAFRFAKLGFHRMLGKHGPRNGKEHPGNMRVIDATNYAPGHSDCRDWDGYYVEIAAATVVA